MADKLLRCSAVKSGKELSLKIEGRLPDNNWSEFLNITPDIRIFGQDTLNLDIFVPHLAWQKSQKNKNELILSGEVESAKLTSKVSARSFDMLRVETVINFSRSARLEMAVDRMRILNFPIDNFRAPYVAPEHECVVGDFAFKSPVVGLESKNSVLSIIPNLKSLRKNLKFPNALNFDANQGVVSFGCLPYRILHNSFFAHYDSDTVDFSRCSIKYSYYISLRNNCRENSIQKQLARTLWRLNSNGLSSNLSILKNKKTKKNDKIIENILNSKWENGLFNNFIKSFDLPETKNKIRLADLSQTCLWLCKNYKEIKSDEKALNFLKKYAEKLQTFQRSGGFFPAWINKETGKTLQLCVRSAETAVHSLFFNELNKLIPDSSYIRSARRGINFVIKKVIKKGNWENSEAFFDLEFPNKKRKSLFKNLKPNHTLSMWWAADALLQLHKTTNSARYLSYGRRALDELALYQQLWTPSFCDKNLYGGFGASNANPIWNYSAQISFAKTFLDYYKVCGLTEYFCRGTAALHASFALKDEKENIADSCRFVNPYSPKLILNPGNVDEEVNQVVKNILNEFGDLYVDTKRQKAFGINGVTIKNIKVDLAGLAIYGKETVGISRQITVKTSSGNSFKVKIKANEDFEIQV